MKQGISWHIFLVGKKRLQHLLARGLRICLGVPRAVDSPLVIAEARQSPLSVLRGKETLQRFFCLSSRHESRLLIMSLHPRVAYQEPYLHVLPTEYAPWRLPPTPLWTWASSSVNTTLPRITNKSSSADYPFGSG